MGEIAVPFDKYWGAATQRSLENFNFGDKMPMEVIYAYALLKKCCAHANLKHKKISSLKCDLIDRACDEIIDGKLDNHFPLMIWQTGSGTQTNMNLNEVIANRGHVLSGGKINDHKKILHPNDDVNMSQSSNDTFPTVMNIVAVKLVSELTSALSTLCAEFANKTEEFSDIIKIGRTHLMDATPISMGQEFSGYTEIIRSCLLDLEVAAEKLYSLAIGGTAVGTGLNAPFDFGTTVSELICTFFDRYNPNHYFDRTKKTFKSAPNKFTALSTNVCIYEIHGIIKKLATYLLKICNDLRLLASGPRCGFGELILPANEPGSSIMPGKVNPTQIEALTMVCAKIIGNDTAISIGEQNGQLELNVYRPLIISCFIESTKLLTQALISFREKCLCGITVDKERIKYYTENALMLITALNPKIGYENASKVATKAYEEKITLKDAAIKLNFVTGEEYDALIDIRKMV
jgi:fumarate hydratase class II